MLVSATSYAGWIAALSIPALVPIAIMVGVKDALTRVGLEVSSATLPVARIQRYQPSQMRVDGRAF